MLRSFSTLHEATLNRSGWMLGRASQHFSIHRQGKLFSYERISTRKKLELRKILFDISDGSMYNMLGNKLNDITFLLFNGCA